ncbi:DNA helicase rad5 [Thecaphora frezii]
MASQSSTGASQHAAPAHDFFASSPISTKTASQPDGATESATLAASPTASRRGVSDAEVAPEQAHAIAGPSSPSSPLRRAPPRRATAEAQPLFFDIEEHDDDEDYFATQLPPKRRSSADRHPDSQPTPSFQRPEQSTSAPSSPSRSASTPLQAFASKFGGSRAAAVDLAALKRPRSSIPPTSSPPAAASGRAGKKRSSAVQHDRFERRYIGTFVLSAWSMSKGTGYVQPGDAVRIFRPRKKIASTQAATGAKGGKPATGGAKKTRQTTLNFGPAASGSLVGVRSKAKEKEDYIVRFGNMRGFEVGRMPLEVATWMSKLLDIEMAEFEGSVVDCPHSLTVGCDIILQVKAYIRWEAFFLALTAGQDPSSEFEALRPETMETSVEKSLRERKVSLLRLFRACDLKPSLSNSILKGHKANNDLGSEAMLEQYGGDVPSTLAAASPTQARSRSPPEPAPASADAAGSLAERPIELDENGGAKPAADDDQPNDGTEVTLNQLDQVYSKAQLHDADLPEVDPPETFALNLRPYQKQALGWMKTMERVAGDRDGNAADAQKGRELSLHPLWEEYEFPMDYDNPSANGALVTSNTRTFYFSPYTGDLSLDFQKSSKGSRGGILADEMGLGKTIMVASLIHANRAPEGGEISEDDDSGDDDDEDLSRQRSKRARTGVNAAKQTSLASAFAASGAGDQRKAMLRASVSRGKATLVVAPMSLLSQWRDELTRASQPGTLSVMLYYADAKADIIAQLEGGGVDVVVTSYGTLTTEYKRFVDAGGFGSRHVATVAPLFAVEWLRVILDEAHHIKNRNTRNARACCDLVARRRWCLTGTPIVNRLTDLFSLLKFLRVEPWGDFSFFNSFISKPFANRNPKALEVVQVVLESVLLRREKRMRDKDGQPIVELPPKTVEVRQLEFTPLERQIYDNVYRRAYVQYATMKANGTVGRNFSVIFSVLMRLRQAVCHPLLVLKGEKAGGGGGGEQGDTGGPEAKDVAASFFNDDPGSQDLRKLVAEFQTGSDKGGDGGSGEAYTAQVLEQLIKAQEGAEGADDEDDDCPICFETEVAKCYLPKCMHNGCKDCILGFLQACEDRQEEPCCPMCRKGPVAAEDLIEAVRLRRRRSGRKEEGSTGERPLVAALQGDAAAPSDNGGAGLENDGTDGGDEETLASSQHSQPVVYFQRNDFRTSTKLTALVAHLNELRLAEPGFKGVIFSQFTSFLDLVQVCLERNRHAYVRLDGTTSQREREQVLRQFETDKPKGSLLMLISLRAGGVGLNLTCANRVWLLDCWWNKSTEDQAVDRIHRLGQTRPVTVYRYLINDSIEDRILQIQKRKEALVSEALAGRREGKSEALENLELLFGA